MPSRTLPGIGLKGDWDLGEDGWKPEMDSNLRVLSILAGQQVLEIVAAEPGAPAEGDIVILDETHATHPNEIAAYDEAAWAYIIPLEGMQLFNLDDGLRYEFDGAVWSAATIPGVGDMLAANNLSDVANASTALANIGGAPKLWPIILDASAAFTLDLADAFTHIRLTAAGGCVVTVPDNATVAYPIGTKIRFTSAGAAASSLVAAGGVTLNSRGAALTAAGQYAVYEIEKVATDAWDVVGDLA